jgi:UDP-N-acetylmuramyl tripeptide synthase
VLIFQKLLPCFIRIQLLKLRIIGVTGTNGKTTIASLLYQLFNLAGRKSGLLFNCGLFVGDEVVLTWKSEIGYRNNNALRFFYSFQEVLKVNGNYFKSNYGVTPIFKAGLHRGIVSVAEVGEINTQIAYHGDVVNTTSRIQELCNVYKTNLLVSEKLHVRDGSPS